MAKDKKQVVGVMRQVPMMNVAVWRDGYQWLENNGETSQLYLAQVVEAVERGYTPDEIFHHVIREAGPHRAEIAERCRAAANWIIHTNQE